MTEPSMIERIARILCRQAGYDPDGGPRCGISWVDFEARAREVVEGMREPSEAMQDAGLRASLCHTDVCDGEAYVSFALPRAVLTAMIDKALEGGGG